MSNEPPAFVWTASLRRRGLGYDVVVTWISVTGVGYVLSRNTT